MEALKETLGQENYAKLMKIDNTGLHQFVEKYIELCNPEKVFVFIPLFLTIDQFCISNSLFFQMCFYGRYIMKILSLNIESFCMGPTILWNVSFGWFVMAIGEIPIL